MPRKQTHEEFVQDIKNINPTIKIIGKYQKAKERIECSCNICNFEWNPMAYSLKYGIGCPNCGNMDQNKMSVTLRTCGYLGCQYWNQGRTQEIKERVLHL